MREVIIRLLIILFWLITLLLRFFRAIGVEWDDGSFYLIGLELDIKVVLIFIILGRSVLFFLIVPTNTLIKVSIRCVCVTCSICWRWWLLIQFIPYQSLSRVGLLVVFLRAGGANRLRVVSIIILFCLIIDLKVLDLLVQSGRRLTVEWAGFTQRDHDSRLFFHVISIVFLREVLCLTIIVLGRLVLIGKYTIRNLFWDYNIKLLRLFIVIISHGESRLCCLIQLWKVLHFDRIIDGVNQVSHLWVLSDRLHERDFIKLWILAPSIAGAP